MRDIGQRLRPFAAVRLLSVALAPMVVGCGDDSPANSTGAGGAVASTGNHGGSGGEIIVGGGGSTGEGGAGGGIGGLDPTFGKGGVVETSLPIWPLALTPDVKGRLLVFGIETQNEGRFEIVRFLESGELDASYGKGGVASIPVGTAGQLNSGNFLSPDGVAVDASGIYVGGKAQSASNPSGAFVARFDAEANLDTAFGDQGFLRLGGPRAATQAVSVTSSGKILALFGEDDLDTAPSVTLVRFDEKGALDPTFAAGAPVQIEGLTHVGSISTGCVREDEKGTVRAVAKKEKEGTSSTALVLITLTQGGFVETAELEGPPTSTGCAIDAAGNAYVFALGQDNTGVVAKLGPDGTLDASYGKAGLVNSGVQSLQAWLAESNGQTFVAGRATVDGAEGQLAVRYVDPTGAPLDPLWKVGGVNGYYYDVARQADGKVILAGDRIVDGSDARLLVLTRYNPPASVPPPPK